MWNRFLEDENIVISDDAVKYLQNFKNTKVDYPEIDHEELLTVLSKYRDYENSCCAGELGKTPQFYCLYITLINYSFLLSRSVRTEDFPLLKYALEKI